MQGLLFACIVEAGGNVGMRIEHAVQTRSRV
jgi:hypothetical protein